MTIIMVVMIRVLMIRTMINIQKIRMMMTIKAPSTIIRRI